MENTAHTSPDFAGITLEKILASSNLNAALKKVSIQQRGSRCGWDENGRTPAIHHRPPRRIEMGVAGRDVSPQAGEMSNHTKIGAWKVQRIRNTDSH